jgi:O-antigen/teichoic acid export membrane protein
VSVVRPDAEADDVLAGADVGGRVVRGGAARFAGYGVGSLLGAVSSVFLLRYLGVADFGRYGTVMALMSIVTGITDAGLTITGNRELALLPRGRPRRALMGQIVGIRVVVAALGVGAAVAFAAIAGYGSQLVQGTLLAGVGTVAISFQAALLIAPAVEMENGRIALSETVKQAFQALAVVALVVAGAGLLAFFGAFIGVGVAMLAFTPLLLGRGRLVAPRFGREQWARLLTQALPVAIAAVVSVIYLRVLVVEMSLLSEPDPTGLFVTSARIVELAAGLPLLLTGVALPVVTVAARDNPGRLRYVLQRMTEVSLLAGMLLALAFALGAHLIVTVLGGPDYAGAAPLLRIQGLTLVTIFLVQGWLTTLVATGRQRLLTLTTTTGLATVLILGLVLIPAFDAHGAAVAAAIADAALALATLAALRHAGPGRELSFAFVPRAVLAGALGAAVLLVPGLGDIPRLLIGLPVFLAAVVALRLVPAEVTDALPRRRS